MELAILRKYFKWALFNFFILSLAGLFLRFLLIHPVNEINYQYFLHAHSHFAFSGWGFMALSILLSHSFIPKKIIEGRSFRKLLWLSLIPAYGMLLSFPFKGYFSISIAFSTLFIIVNIWFVLLFFKATKQQPRTLSLQTARLALIFLGLSSLGPFALGPVMASGQGGSPLYFNVIYYYLHFQYNGWMSLGIISLLLKWIEQQDKSSSKKNDQLCYFLLLISIVLTYALSLLWNKPANAYYIIGGGAAVLQCAAFFLLFKKLPIDQLRSLPTLQRTILLIALLAFAVKAGMQLFSAFPFFADLAYKIRYLIIGYLHLVFLGGFSFFVLFYSIHFGLIPHTRLLKYGIYLFFAGFFLSEFLLFTESLFSIFNLHIPHFQTVLFIVSLALPPSCLALWLTAEKK
ncbi:hypothetical protein [Solitalea longa]|nr:hypothetical protein [Solitalea longa]